MPAYVKIFVSIKFAVLKRLLQVNFANLYYEILIPICFTFLGYKTDLNGLRPLNISQLSVDNCEMDARNLNKYYESMFFVKSNISIDDAFDILRDKRNFNFTKNYIMSIGKLCNVKIPRNKFRDALQQIRTYKTKFLYWWLCHRPRKRKRKKKLIQFLWKWVRKCETKSISKHYRVLFNSTLDS